MSSIKQDVRYEIIEAESLSALARKVQKILDNHDSYFLAVRCEGGIMIDRSYTRAMGNNGADYAQVLVFSQKEVSPGSGEPFGMRGRAG